MGSRNEKVNILVGAKDKTKGVLGNVQKQIIGIGAAYLGWRAVTGVLGDIVEKGKEHEKAWNDVAASLKRHEHEVDSNLGKIKAFSDEMQTMSGESDEVIGKMVQGFLDYGQTVDEAMETTKVAMDLAAGAGMDMKSATDLLAKAAVGYTSTLSRYGIIIDENIPKSEKFAAAIDQINQRFGGAAADRADTIAVKMALVGQRIGDLEEELFKLFAPTLLSGLNTAIGVLNSFMGIFESGLDKVKKAQSQFDETSASTLRLADRYDELASRTNLTNIEQDELNRILAAFQEQNPGIITAWDDMGTAIGANTDRLRENLEAERSLLAIRMQDELKELGEQFHTVNTALSAGIELLENKKAIDTDNERLLEAQRRGWETVAEAITANRDRLQELLFEGRAAFPELKIGTERYSYAVRILGQDFVDLIVKQQEAIQAISVGTEETTQESLDRTGSMFDDFAGEYTHTWHVARKAREDEDAEYSVTTMGIHNQIHKGYVKFEKETAKGHGETIAKMTIAQQAFANAAYGSMSNAVDNMIDSLEFLHTESKGIFKNMAADFTIYFIDEALKQLAVKFIGTFGGGGILGILSSIFDTSANDRMAMIQGRHFAQFFTRGMLGEMSGIGSRITPAVVPSVAVSMPGQSGGYAPMSGGDIYIHNHFHGNIIGEDVWVEDHMIPKIERAVKSGRSNLAIQNDNLTDRAAMESI